MMNLRERAEMCTLAAADMGGSEPWVEVLDWGWASGCKIASEIEETFAAAACQQGTRRGCKAASQGQAAGPSPFGLCSFGMMGMASGMASSLFGLSSSPAFGSKASAASSLAGLAEREDKRTDTST